MRDTLKTYENEDLSKIKWAKINTQKGVIWIKLFGDETPSTVANFAHLANTGFYNDLSFHPTSGTSTDRTPAPSNAITDISLSGSAVKTKQKIGDLSASQYLQIKNGNELQI